jgi:hypothetical protein
MRVCLSECVNFLLLPFVVTVGMERSWIWNVSSILTFEYATLLDSAMLIEIMTQALQKHQLGIKGELSQS